MGDTLYADNIFDPYPPLQLAQGGVSGLLGGIAENIVVWEELVGWQTTIYGYNLATNTKFPIVEDVTTSGFPIAISADREPGRFVVVWGDNRTGVTDLYGMILDGPLVAGCASYAPADLNHDCRVDGLDLALLAEDWLASSQVVNPLYTEDDVDDNDTEEEDDSEPSRSR